MKFKISKKEVIRRKYIVPIQMSIPILLFLGLVWTQQKSQEEFFFSNENPWIYCNGDINCKLDFY